MDLTISSVVTMCLLNSVLVVALCLFFRLDVILKRIGPSCMIVLLLAMVLRMFVPFEFPYTYSVRIEDLLTPVRRVLTYAILSEPMKVTVWHVLIGIWILGSVLCFAERLYCYGKITRCIQLLPRKEWSEISKQYHFAVERYPDITKIKVVCSNQINSPYLVGFRTPYLVLPDVAYKANQFRYIVLHELMHVRNKDISWKILIDLLCTVFWWNPVFVLLKRELFQLIEMRNDMQIISMLSDEETIAYMECLRDMAVQLTGKDVAFGLSFSRSELKELSRRMRLLASDKHFSTLLQVVLSVVVGALLLLTTAVIVEPYSVEKVEEGIVATAGNTILIKNGDKYDVYIEGEYFFTTEDLTPFPGVEIYNDIKEVPQDE